MQGVPTPTPTRAPLSAPPQRRAVRLTCVVLRPPPPRAQTVSPRQLQLMAQASTSMERDVDDAAIGTTAAGTLKEIPVNYLTQRLGVTRDNLDDP